jgi:hypothetical protein
MTLFERRICDAFLSRFTGEQSSMRLRSISVFPEFDTVGPDEKASYLEAAESLEQKGLISLKWEKHHKGERLKTLNCLCVEKLYAAAGVNDPNATAADVRTMIKKKIPAFEQINSDTNGSGVVRQAKNVPDSSNIISFLNYLGDHFSPQDVGSGIDLRAAEDFLMLLEFLCMRESSGDFSRIGNLSTRALSVKLFNDSKRLERILVLTGPLFTRAKKQVQNVPDLSFLERSLPETFIAGKLVFEYRANECDRKGQTPPLVNSSGHILGFPLSSAREIIKIRTLDSKEIPSVLTIENKETFYALASSLSCYECFLYTGGYVNRAAAAFIKILSASGFCFYHAGDLDPDGILILQNVHDLANKPVVPVGMDAVTFDRYLPHARPLSGTVLRQAAKIRDGTRTIPGIAELLRRILETGKGVEQEVVVY